jgi:hypothetical protein
LDYRIAITKLKNSDEWVDLPAEVRQQIIQQEKSFITLADAKNIPNDKWGVSNDAFLSGRTSEEILSIVKGKRPLVETYLDARYIRQHLAKFEQEGIASRIVLKKDYERFGIGKPDLGKTEYVSTKSEIDEILKLPISDQAQKLGVSVNQLLDGEVIRIDFKLTDKYKVEMPTGNEWGTNSLWIPGGKLPDGNLEAIIKTEGMKEGVDYSVNIIK